MLRETKAIRESYVPLNVHDLCEQANQQSDRMAARHALAGWDSSDGEKVGYDRSKPPLLAKRKALE
jgi:hypothetical protein